RDDLERLDDAGHDDVLQAAVEILRVLPDDYNIDIVKAARDAGHVRDRAKVRVEIERFTQPYVDRGKALADGRSDGPFQRDTVAADRFQDAFRQRISFALLGLAPHDLLLERERRARGLEDRDDGVGDLRPDAVPFDQRNGSVRHESRVTSFLPAKSST